MKEKNICFQYGDLLTTDFMNYEHVTNSLSTALIFYTSKFE